MREQRNPPLVIHRPSLGYAGIVGEPDAPRPWIPGAVWESEEHWLELHVDWGGGEAAQLQLGVVPVGTDHSSPDLAGWYSGGLECSWGISRGKSRVAC